MEYEIHKKYNVEDIVDKVIPLLNPNGYDDYSEYEDAVHNAIIKIGIKVLFQTDIRNAIRTKKEYLNGIVDRMKNKIEFLIANERRLNKYNKECFAKIKNLKRDEYNLANHKKIDMILSSNFSTKELVKKGVNNA
ncbi:MAG: hypothetical protein LHV68_05235 [Elusimicrobia bacterium]|nr:hypothetical protein [Candidatus Liberimonas magnetica]